MHEKTGHDNKGMSGHGFTFPGGGSVPVIFISMVVNEAKFPYETDVTGVIGIVEFVGHPHYIYLVVKYFKNRQ
jgi:hypothetical protein